MYEETILISTGSHTFGGYCDVRNLDSINFIVEFPDSSAITRVKYHDLFS